MRLMASMLLLVILCGCATLGGGLPAKNWQAVVIEMDAPNWKHSHKRVTADGQLTSVHLSGHTMPWLHQFSARMTPQDLAALNTLIASLTPDELQALGKPEAEQKRPDYRRVTIEFDDGSRLVAVTGERENFGNATMQSIWSAVRKYSERAW